MTTTQLDADGARSQRGRRLLAMVAPFLSILAVMAIFFAIDPSRSNDLFTFQAVSVHTVVVGLAALGMTLIIVSGGIDLSVGSSIALSSVVCAVMLDQGYSVPIAVVATVMTGALCGLYNGLLITLLRLPPFIATLGTLGFYRGVAKWLADQAAVSPDSTGGINEWVSPIPKEEWEWMIFAPAVWLLLLLVAVMTFVLRSSILGRYAIAIGSNEPTARLCGIAVGRTKVMIYVAAGALAGLAGLMQFGRLSQGDPTVAIGLELDIIAAVVIGGGSLAGGQGSMVGAIAGAFLMAYLRNRCTVVGWENYVQEIIVGHIIIVAVAVDQWRLRRG